MDGSTLLIIGIVGIIVELFVLVINKIGNEISTKEVLKDMTIWNVILALIPFVFICFGLTCTTYMNAKYYPSNRPGYVKVVEYNIIGTDSVVVGDVKKDVTHIGTIYEVRKVNHGTSKCPSYWTHLKVVLKDGRNIEFKVESREYYNNCKNGSEIVVIETFYPGNTFKLNNIDVFQQSELLNY